MDLHDVFALAGRLGVRLHLEGDIITVDPADGATVELAQAIRANKRALLVELRMIEAMSRVSWAVQDVASWRERRRGRR